MKHYEGMFILHNRDPGPKDPVEEGAEPPKPPTHEEVVQALVEKCGGEVKHLLNWANRKLSYPIKGNQTGTYIICYFSGDSSVNDKLNREVHLSDRCLRHMVVSVAEIPGEDDLPGPLNEPQGRANRRADYDLPIEGTKEGGKPLKIWDLIDYKNPQVLRRMISGQGKLFSRVRSNLESKNQHRLRRAVHRARNMALLPFVGR